MTESTEATASGTKENAARTRARSGRSARLVGAGILLSRVAGFVRERALAHFLGTSLFASAFRSALRIPNIIQNLLGEGTLSASFIPVYARLLERGEEEEAGRLAGAVFALLLAIAGLFAILGITLAGAIVHITSTGFHGEIYEVSVRCTRILFPMTGMLVLSAWALGILNSHRRFFVSYSAPVLWNVAIIAAVFVFAAYYTGSDLVAAVSWGALAGGVLQFLVQLPWVVRLDPFVRLHWDVASANVRQVMRNAGPVLVGRGVVQLVAFLDLFLASFLFLGAVAVLGYAQTIFLLPVSLFGMSVAAAELPEMSRHGDERREALRARIEVGIQRIAFLVVPAEVGFILLGDVVVGALYQTGHFTRLDTMLVHLVLAGYSVGLVATTSTRLYSSAFYALNDTRTPARMAILRVILASALGALLMLVLERFAVTQPYAIVRNLGDIEHTRPLGAAGLALGAGISGWVEWTLLRRRIQQRVGELNAGRHALPRLALAALLPAILLRATLVFTPTLPPLFTAAIVLPLFGATYLLLAAWMGVAQARRTLLRLTNRGERGRH